MQCLAKAFRHHISPQFIHAAEVQAARLDSVRESLQLAGLASRLMSVLEYSNAYWTPDTNVLNSLTTQQNPQAVIDWVCWIRICTTATLSVPYIQNMAASSPSKARKMPLARLEKQILQRQAFYTDASQLSAGAAVVWPPWPSSIQRSTPRTTGYWSFALVSTLWLHFYKTSSWDGLEAMCSSSRGSR